MYNSTFKYYAKHLLGRKNEMWYFDRWVRCYAHKQRNSIKHFSQLIENYESEFLKIGTIHPLFELAESLRQESINKYFNYYKLSNISVALHVPPVNYSQGANSFFNNLRIALEHMGVNVYTFWDSFEEENFRNVDIFLGVGAKYITDTIDWVKLNQFKLKYKFKTILQASYDIMDLRVGNDFIEYYQSLKVDYFFSFDFESFNINSGQKKFFIDRETDLFSMPFSANPLLHYPCKYQFDFFDYIFIGSINYDKIKRYNLFFDKIVNSNYNGIIAGPSWKWCSSFDYNVDRDRILYSHSKIGLNLHLDNQINSTGQLNERTYILAATGIPQVIDSVVNMESVISNIGLKAESPKAYIDSIQFLLSDHTIRTNTAKDPLIQVYKHHTTFVRVIELFKQLKLAL